MNVPLLVHMLPPPEENFELSESLNTIKLYVTVKSMRGNGSMNHGLETIWQYYAMGRQNGYADY